MSEYKYLFNGPFVKISVHKGQAAFPYKNGHAVVSAYNPVYPNADISVHQRFNPENQNYLTTPALREFEHALDVVAGEDVKYAIFNWNGPTTGYGMSPHEFAERLKDRERFKDWLDEHLYRFADIAIKARTLPCHTISVLHGYRFDKETQKEEAGVVGGSLELGWLFDEVLITARTLVRLPEVCYGAVPPLGAPLAFERAGRHNAELLVATGGTISGETAVKTGLADRLVAEGRHFFAAYETVQSGKRPERQKAEYQLTDNDIDLAARRVLPAPLALTGIPQMMDSIEVAYAANGMTGALRVAGDACRELCLSDDFREGMTAFVEKREPKYTGN